MQWMQPKIGLGCVVTQCNAIIMSVINTPSYNDANTVQCIYEQLRYAMHKTWINYLVRFCFCFLKTRTYYIFTHRPLCLLRSVRNACQNSAVNLAKMTQADNIYLQWKAFKACSLPSIATTTVRGVSAIVLIRRCRYQLFVICVCS